ncbi:MAG: hypothetical protein ACI85V_002534 [bacterium]|jgi:hypothetical protein
MSLGLGLGAIVRQKKPLGPTNKPFNHLSYTSTVDRKPVIVHIRAFNWSTHMRLTTTLAAAAVIAVSGVAANAGGLAPVIPEAPIVIVDAPAPAGGSISSGYIVLGLLAALVAASASF